MAYFSPGAARRFHRCFLSLALAAVASAGTPRAGGAERSISDIANRPAASRPIVRLAQQPPSEPPPFDPFLPAQQAPSPSAGSPSDVSPSDVSPSDASPVVTPPANAQPINPPPGRLPPQDVPPGNIAPRPELVPPPAGNGSPEVGEQDWLKPLSDISLDISPPVGTLPRDTAAPRFAERGTVDFRGHEGWFETLPAHPIAPFCFQPLYFEDITLERYGADHGPLVQPVLSGARFYVTVPAMPYLMSLEPPCECAYPDYWSNIDKPSIAQHRRAALVEAGVIAGLILLIP